MSGSETCWEYMLVMGLLRSVIYTTSLHVVAGVLCLPKQALAAPAEATQGWTNPRERRVFDEQMHGQTDRCMDG